MEKDYIDVPIEHEAAAMNLIKNQTKEFLNLFKIRWENWFGKWLITILSRIWKVM